jgi:hypothetical protein
LKQSEGIKMPLQRVKLLAADAVDAVDAVDAAPEPTVHGPTVQELRATLAGAIEDAAAAGRAAESGRAAIERARSFVSEAEKRLAAATEGVAEQKQRFVARTTAAAAGDDAAVPISMRAVRMAEIEAADELEASKAALELVKGGIAALEEEARVAGHHAAAARNAVLAAGAAPLLAEAERLRVKFLQHLAVLSLLTEVDHEAERRRRFSRNISIRELNADEDRSAPLAETKAATNGLVSQLLSDLERLQHTHVAPAVELWNAARASLMRDPATPLPPT